MIEIRNLSTEVSGADDGSRTLPDRCYKVAKYQRFSGFIHLISVPRDNTVTTIWERLILRFPTCSTSVVAP